MTSLTFYGGVGEIGGNKILLEDGTKSLLLDFGLSYKPELVVPCDVDDEDAREKMMRKFITEFITLCSNR